MGCLAAGLLLVMLSTRLLLVAGGGGSFSAPEEVPATGPLARWQEAVDDVATDTVDIVTIGDSITEGQDATTNANRWVELLGTGLVALHGTQSDVYRPAGDGGGLASQPWTFSGGTAVGDFGLGRRARQYTAAGTASTSFTGTGFSLLYVKGPGLGSFNYVVDSGGTTTVSTSGASLVGGQMETVTGLSAGTHTLSVRWASGTVYLEGMIPDTGTGGFRIWEAGHGSYGVFEYTDGPYEHWADALTTIDPDLVILMVGATDHVFRRPSAQVRTRYEQLVARVRSLTDASIMVIAEWRIGGSATYAEPWSNYVDEIADMASDDGDVTYIDLVPTFTPGYAPADPDDGLIDDGTHPNDAGMSILAGVVLADL